MTDSGVGLVADRIEGIFELFKQAGSAAEGSQPGLGIGLHLVKSFTEMHRGTVRAFSSGPGCGSTFVVRLPIAPPEMELPIMVSQHATGSGRSRALRVLLAEDNLDAAASLAALLQMSGHTVEVAVNGEQAIALAESMHPDLILLDLGMPKINGAEAARRIRMTDWGKGATLIALTGWSPAEVAKRGESGLFTAQLTKPVEVDAVERLLDAFARL